MKSNELQVGGTHYRGTAFQHWDWVVISRIGYLEGCATKYVFRWRQKNGVEDLKKALHFVKKLIEMNDLGVAEPKKDFHYSDDPIFNLFTANADLTNLEIEVLQDIGYWTPASLAAAVRKINALIEGECA